MKIFEKLLDAGVLSETDVKDLETAITFQLEESKRDHLDQVRAEYAARMQQDRNSLVEAIDAKLSAEMTTVITEKVDELNRLIELKNTEIADVRVHKEAYAAARDNYLESTVALKKAQEEKLAETITAMNDFVTESIEREMTEFAIEKQAVLEAKERYTTAVDQVQVQFRTELREQVSKLRKFIIESLEVETDKLQSERKKLVEQRNHMEQEFFELKKTEQIMLEAKADAIDTFVTEAIRKEVAEFQEDKQALVEARVKFAAEAKHKLKETQEKFLRNASAEIDKKVTDVLKSELSTLKEDIQRARENEFGRKIFEVLAEQVKENFINTNDEVKKLQESISAMSAQNAKTEAQLAAAKRQILVANNEAKLIKESAARNQKMDKLLAPLTGDKRRIMSELLSNVRTERLDEAFDKYIDNVISTSKQPTRTATLVEKTEPLVESIVVTGDREHLVEETISAPAVTEAEDADLMQLIKLQGRRK